MRLLIDTTKQHLAEVALLDGKNRVVKSFSKKSEKISENLLHLLDRLLKNQKLALKEIEKVYVNPGPGGFSSTRTGVATANALAFAFDIPIAGYPYGRIRKIVLPKYDKEPNISKPKNVRTKEPKNKEKMKIKLFIRS